MKAGRIRPISDLKNRARELVRDVSESGAPIVITQNGKPKVVVMDVEQHDRLQDTLAMLKLLAHSQAQLESTGRTYSSAEVRRRAMATLAKARRRA